MASIHSEIALEPAGAGGLVDIDGMRPQLTLTPRSPDELAEVLSTAEREAHGVAPVGGVSKLALGNPLERLDCAI